MFKSVKATTIEEYLGQLPQDRKSDLEFLIEVISSQSNNLKPYFAQNMIGFGSFKYKNYKKEIIDWPLIALASQKNYISVYVCATIEGKYVAESAADKLGNVSVGKSCIRFKHLQDLNLEEFKKVVKLTSTSEGLVRE